MGLFRDRGTQKAVFIISSGLDIAELIILDADDFMLSVSIKFKKSN